MNKEERMYELLNHRNDDEIKTTGLFEDIEALLEENKQLKEDIKNIINILNNNCDDLEATEEEFNSLDRWENEIFIISLFKQRN